MVPDFSKSIAFLEGSQTSPVCPSGKKNVQMKIGGMILTGETVVLAQNLLQFQFVHQKFHTDWPGIESGSSSSQYGH